MTSAFYLPLGLEEGLETTVQRFGPAHDALELHLPVVEPETLARWIEVLREAREVNLARRPVGEIIRALDRVVRRFLDARDPARIEAIDSLGRTGRFTAPMLQRALDDAFQPLTRGGLARWVESELGSTAALDRPVPSGPRGIKRRAHGPEWMLQIYAGNVPTLPVWPLLGALLLKAAVLAKTSAQEPLLAPLLARTIAEEDEKLGACMAVVWWKGGTADLDPVAARPAPAILAFGGDDAIASIARHSSRGTRLVLHGPKLSIGYIERRSLTYAALGGIVARAALDVSLYDQQGCLSPHAFYLERRGEVPAEKFAEALAGALESASRDLPPGIASPDEGAGIQLLRSQARFEAAAGAGPPYAGSGHEPEAEHRRGAPAGVLTAEEEGGAPGDHGSAPERHAILATPGIVGATRVLESGGSTTWTVILEDSARFEPGPTRRTVRIYSVEGPEELGRALRGSARYVEALGLEARGPERARLAAYFTELGIPRVAPLGSLQHPTPLGTHGGLGRLLPFVTWSLVEEPPPLRAGKAPSRRPASRSSARGSPRKGRAPGR